MLDGSMRSITAKLYDGFSASPTASCDTLLLRPQLNGGLRGTLPGKALGDTPKPGMPTHTAIHQGKWKARHTRAHVVTVELAGGVGRASCRVRLTEASLLPPPQLCQYYH